MATETTSAQFNKAKHIKYWQRCHSSFLPAPYTASDSTRLTFACFTIAALDLLSAPLTPADRSAIRRWVLSLQHPDGGFCGSSTHVLPGQDASKGNANLAASFFALILLGLAADGEEEAKNAFAGVQRTKLLQWLKKLQREDGSFGQNLWESQAVGGNDTRHSYMASSIRWMVRGDVKEGEEGWVEDVDVNTMVAHIRNGQTYDGGIAETSQNESHALTLLDRPQDSTAPKVDRALDEGVPDRDGLIAFLASRTFPYLQEQEQKDEVEENFLQSDAPSEITHIGYNGRCNKKADTCYCWWAIGTLEMLGNGSLTNVPLSRQYLIDITQHVVGGFSKAVGGPPDLYHSYLGLAALAAMGESDLKDLDVGLCCSKETTKKIELAREGLLEHTRGKKGWEGDGFW
ncbi:geranylgeranyl transferase type I beta subunit [Mariannaea sp. PMI_226]|nr:geranylgeranyl transferase type I beta subunit [Mariannaea sp. PMI_226]